MFLQRTEIPPRLFFLKLGQPRAHFFQIGILIPGSLFRIHLLQRFDARLDRRELRPAIR